MADRGLLSINTLEELKAMQLPSGQPLLVSSTPDLTAPEIIQFSHILPRDFEHVLNETSRAVTGYYVDFDSHSRYNNR